MKKKQTRNNDLESMFPGTRVFVRGNNIHFALQKLKRKVQDERIMQDYREHCFYEKPGDKRRRKAAAARKRHIREKTRREEEFSALPVVKALPTKNRRKSR